MYQTLSTLTLNKSFISVIHCKCLPSNYERLHRRLHMRIFRSISATFTSLFWSISSGFSFGTEFEWPKLPDWCVYNAYSPAGFPFGWHRLHLVKHWGNLTDVVLRSCFALFGCWIIDRITNSFLVRLCVFVKTVVFGSLTLCLKRMRKPQWFHLEMGTRPGFFSRLLHNIVTRRCYQHTAFLRYQAKDSDWSLFAPKD